MLRRNASPRALVILAAAVALIAALVVALAGGPSGARGVAAANPSPSASIAQPYGPPGLARYDEGSPHVTSQVNVYALRGQVGGAPATPPDELNPVSPGAFQAPVAAYRTYSVKRLKLMQGQIAKLSAALAAGDREAAEAAWEQAYGYYLNLGAVYLEGPVADLNSAIDGTPGGLPGGTSSAKFRGLHRLELGLWTGEPLSSLQPWTHKLSVDIDRLAMLVPHVLIDPADYATRAHEILEDALRDELSGTDAPWSGAGVLGTAAGVVATSEVVKTLAPILTYRESVLPTVDGDMASLQSTLASLQRSHGGTLPTKSQLTRLDSERLAASLGQALEGLAQIPGALETTVAPVTPRIPASAVKIDP
jgi:iron uptake system EfeUOB component EfeO/EfeM